MNVFQKKEMSGSGMAENDKGDDDAPRKNKKTKLKVLQKITFRS